MSLGSGGGCFVRLWHCRLLSVPSGEHASGRRWDCSGLGHVARRCFGTKWYSDVAEAQNTRDGDTGNEEDSSFAWFFNLHPVTWDQNDPRPTFCCITPEP